MDNTPFYSPSTSHALFFRSDTRSPTEIFANGFKSRLPFHPIGIKTYPDGKKDVDSNTAVCFSRDFAAAALFPYTTPTQPSWIYVMELRLKSVENVHSMQYTTGLHALQSAPNRDPEVYLFGLHGQERASKIVSNDSIVGAVQIARRPAVDGRRQYAVWDFVANPSFRGSPELAPALNEGAMELRRKGWQNTPEIAEGFIRNDPTALFLPEQPAPQHRAQRAPRFRERPVPSGPVPLPPRFHEQRGPQGPEQPGRKHTNSAPSKAEPSSHSSTRRF